jgi:hypothetical protein
LKLDTAQAAVEAKGAVVGITVEGSTVEGSTVAGSTVEGSTVAGSTVEGSTVEGSTVAGREDKVARVAAGMVVVADVAAIGHRVENARIVYQGGKSASVELAK